jgi:hypothetical protein
MARETKRLQRTRLLPQEVKYRQVYEKPVMIYPAGTKYVTPGGLVLKEVFQNNRWKVVGKGQLRIYDESFTSQLQLQKAVIQYLRSVDKFGDRAIFPGSKRCLEQ